jgi:hypothetical protein
MADGASFHFADRFIEQARGQALWVREGAGSGSHGAASSELAAGLAQGSWRGCACRDEGRDGESMVWL